MLISTGVVMLIGDTPKQMVIQERVDKLVGDQRVERLILCAL